VKNPALVASVALLSFLLLPSLSAPDSRVSVQTHLTSYGVSPGELDLETIDAMKDAGVSWVRHWMLWHHVEHDSGVYYWSHQDSIINAYSSRGINVYITLMGGNQFYDPESVNYQPDSLYPRPELGLPPSPGSSSLTGWLDFVSAAVTRYGGVVKHWSVWNEPNLREYWAPDPDPGQYSYLVTETSTLIKSIDSTARIIGGNLSMIDLSFFSQILDSIIPYVDYIGYHPYRAFPEDDQQEFLDFLPEPFPPEDSLYSFEQEISALIDSIRLRDAAGRVGIWDDESGYPSHAEPLLWGGLPVISEVTQAKYMLRKHLLSFAFGARVSNWWWDFDLLSTSFNVLGEHWFGHFYDLVPSDWLEKQHTFFFNYIGLSYAPVLDTALKEAEDYDTLTGWWEDSGTFVSTADSAPEWDPGTYASYTVPLPGPGMYTVWMRMRNPNPSRVPGCIIMVDSIGPPYHLISTLDPSDTTRFIWSLVQDAESLRVSYWGQGPRQIYLDMRSHKLFAVPGPGGTQVDKILLKREGGVSQKKVALSALSNLTALFSTSTVPDTHMSPAATNVDLDPADFAELRVFAFRDTSSGGGIVTYWVGKEAVDVYPDRFIGLSVIEGSTESARLVDLLTGMESDLSFDRSGDTLVFDSLPVWDSPRAVLLSGLPGVSEGSGPLAAVTPWCFPNPTWGNVWIQFSAAASSLVELSVYDVAGRLVTKRRRKLTDNGSHRLEWDSKSLAPGIYFWRLTVGQAEHAGKIVVLR